MSRTAPLGLALGLLATAAVPASAQSKIVIDFEDQAPGQVIWNQYQGKGVLFPSRPMVIQHTLATHSGTHSLLSAPFSNEFDPGPLQVAFLAPQASVGVRLGLAKGAPSGTKILMRAYDKQQGGTLVTQSTTTIASPGPTAITTPLTVSAAKAVISRVEIEFSTANFEVVDDLEFDIAGSAPPPDTQAPVVTISTPAEAQVFTVANPQVPLAYTVADDGYLKQVSVLVKGPATQTQFTICGDGHAACWGAPPSLSANFWTLAFYGTNEVTVTAVDFGGNSGSATRKFTVAAPAAGPFDLLIITPEEFSSALSPLVAHKNATQMPATMLTLESIYNDITFSGARDVQEKVKRAIDRARRDWKTRYVMLVGDVDKLPVRYTRTLDPVSWGNGYSPSDLYYADLYDSKGVFDDWDSDDDGEYGEMNSGNPTGWSQLNQDGVDLEPDVAVGRIPASTALEVQRLVGRIISFEKSNPDQRILLVTGNFDDPHPTSNHVATILSQLGYTSVKHYWTTDWTTIPDSDPQWATKRANLLKAEIDKGVQFVTYLGHGAGGWPGTAGQNGGLWAGWYDYTRVPSLSNSGHYPIVLAAACDTAMFNYPHWPYQTKAGGQYTPVSGLPNSQQTAPEPAAVQPAQYDLDTMAEHFMLKSDVGAIAYYGAYTGVQPAAFKVIQRFFEELVALGGSATLGDVWAGGVKRYITYDFPAIPGYWGNWYASAIYHHIQKMMLFGDPSLRIGSQAGKSAFCQAHPQLCLTFKGSPIRYIYRGDPLRFVEAGARYVIAVDGLNQVFGAAEPLEGRWHEAILHLRARTGSVAASVYDDTGRLVAREQQVGDRATTIRLRGERGRKLLLVLAAGEGLRLDQAVELEVAARPVK